MSVFKKLSKADVTTVLYSANKQWDLPYTCFSTNPYFNIYKGTYITGTFVSEDASVDPVTNGEYERLIYDSMNHMFYQAYNGRLLDTGSLMFNVNTYESASQQRPTQSYFDYNVNPRLVKTFPTGSGAGIRVLSIEQDIYGTKILPYNFKLTSSVYFIVDDGNGNLYDISKNLGGYISGSYFNAESYFLTYDPAWNTHVGNIFYAHGLAIITEPDYQLMFPLPPLAYNDSATFLDTDSPKTIDILSNDIARSCAIDTGSVVISGSNSPYYTVNANGTLTLTTTTVGSYDVYYTVDSLCNSGCSMTSNKAKVRVNVTTAPPTTTTTTSTTTTTTTAPTTTTSTTTSTTTAPTTTTSTTTSTTTLDCGISGSAVETTPTTTTTTSTTTTTTTTPSYTINIYAQLLGTSGNAASLYTSPTGAFGTWTRRGSAMSTSCVIKYSDTVVNGTTIWYKVANNTDDTIVYGMSFSTDAICPGYVGTLCEQFVIVNSATDRAVTSYGIVQGGC
jgi:hypothetical protein